jgi:hypothetical protein
MAKRPPRPPRTAAREWLEARAKELLAERVAGADVPDRRPARVRQGNQRGGMKGGNNR